jgi:hypothetical protein
MLSCGVLDWLRNWYDNLKENPHHVQLTFFYR